MIQEMVSPGMAFPGVMFPENGIPGYNRTIFPEDSSRKKYFRARYSREWYSLRTVFPGTIERYFLRTVLTETVFQGTIFPGMVFPENGIHGYDRTVFPEDSTRKQYFRARYSRDWYSLRTVFTGTIERYSQGRHFLRMVLQERNFRQRRFLGQRSQERRFQEECFRCKKPAVFRFWGYLQVGIV